MATSSEHSRVVLSGILGGRRDLLEKANSALSPEHFPEKVHANIFKMLLRYADQTGGAVMPLKHLDDSLRGKADPGQVLLYTETYEALAEIRVDDAEFAWSVQQLRELAAERATESALAESMEILKRGKTVGVGAAAETLMGHEAARIRILESFQEIDRDLVRQEAPEGDLRDEATEMVNDYAERKSDRLHGRTSGVRFGIDALDRKIGGMQRGELVLAAGYSSDGKSTLCVQAAWSAAIEQNKNVVFLTTETLRPQIRRKIVSRHSRLAQFGLSDGLNSRDLKDGTLPEDLEPVHTAIVNDIARNPAYGRIYIAQVPRAAGLTSVEQRLNRIQRKFDVDMVVMDYLALLVSDRRRVTVREELASTLKDAKLIATTFNNGKGVPFLSPWQVSRAAREAAAELGQYTRASLSETAEATNSPDLIVSLLAPEDNTDRNAELVMQVLKNRDGETANGISVSVDYATSYFRSNRLLVDDYRRGSVVSDDEAFAGLMDGLR